MQEKRRFGRIPFGHPVTLETAAGQRSGKLVDISLKGAKIEFQQMIEVQEGELCRFLLALSDGITLSFTASPIHREGTTLGVKFTQADPDSFSHLLRLMELNTGDAEKIAAELHQIGRN